MKNQISEKNVSQKIFQKQSERCSNCNKENTIKLPIGVKLNYCMYCGSKLNI